MQLKETITKLRRENASLSEALCLLCGSSPDWNSLLRTLPLHVVSRLPAKPPPLLTPPATAQKVLPPQTPVKKGQPEKLNLAELLSDTHPQVVGSTNDHPSCTDLLHATGAGNALSEINQPFKTDGCDQQNGRLCVANGSASSGNVPTGRLAKHSTTTQHDVRSRSLSMRGGSIQAPANHSTGSSVAAKLTQDAAWLSEKPPEGGFAKCEALVPSAEDKFEYCLQEQGSCASCL
jgi:hypothetical protein